MNLIEAERLVRAITEVLEHRAPEARARQLAQDYADLCHAAAHRLGQCAAMLEQEDDHQALQLADAPPALLDLVTRLAFRQSNDWRAFCQANDYAVAEAFEGKFIRQLNDAYGKGLPANHQLYSEYREAILRHQDRQAAAVLRTIVRRNPLDAGPVHELERLEKKILSAMLEQLAGALAATEEARVIALTLEIEALDFQAAPSGEAWRQGQTVRCRALLGQAGERRQHGDWAGAAPLLALVATLTAEHGLELPADQLERRRELEGWVAEAQKVHQENARFQRALIELRQMLDSWEEKQVSVRPLRRGELRAQLDALNRKWREIEQFSRSVPDGLAGRMHKAAGLMSAQLERRDRRARKLAAVAVAAFALAALWAGVQLFASRAARDFAGQLRIARERRQVTASDQLARLILAQRPGLAKTPALWLELTVTSRFLTNEYQLRGHCETNLAWLNGLADRAFAGIAPGQVQARLDALRKEAEAVAGDLQPPLLAALAAFDRRWEEWLGQQREQTLQEARQLLPGLEARAAAELRYERGPEAIRAGLLALQPDAVRLQGWTAPPLPQMRFPAEFELRVSQLQKRLTEVRAELERWDQAAETWRKLPSLEAYLESLKTWRKSEFAPPAHLALANDLLGLNISTTNLLAALLLPNQPEAWESFLQQPAARFMPADVIPVERGKLKLLLDDQNIHYIRTYRLTERSLSSNDLRRVRTIFVRGELVKRDWRTPPRSEQVYDPGHSPGSIAFNPAQYDSAHFGVEDLGRPKERDTFERVRLKQLMDQDGAKYLEPLLGILDALNRETESSPLFRAFLALRLCEIIELRPVEWGGAWSPALAADRQRLQELGAGALQSGDWMCPDRARPLERALEEHFQRARQVSYWQQARFLYELTRRTVAAGVALAGRADALGKPLLGAAPADQAELWGWAGGQRKPALLFRYRASGETYVPVNPALPFTPLFILRADRRQLLSETTQAAAGRASELGAYLPPLFATPYE